jgi:hypothetical protein
MIVASLLPTTHSPGATTAMQKKNAEQVLEETTQSGAATTPKNTGRYSGGVKMLAASIPLSWRRRGRAPPGKENHHRNKKWKRSLIKITAN